MAGTIISSTVTTGVTLGYSGYGTTASTLTSVSITPAGEITNSSGYGVLISDVANGTVTNSGSIISSIDGIYLELSKATLTNNAFISGTNAAIKVKNYAGGEALITNSGTLTGAYGIKGEEASFSNSGLVNGSEFGIKLQISTISNTDTGTLAGDTGVYLEGGSLTNDGTIEGKHGGVSLVGGTAVNFGSITGTLSTGVRVDDATGGGGASSAGSFINYGNITGGIYAAYAGTGSFTNDGALSGRIGIAVGLGGAATNLANVYGSAYGAELFGRSQMSGGASLDNAGSIIGKEIGVTLSSNGSFLNSGYVYGPNYGVAIYNGYLKNTGSIINGDVGVTLSGAAAIAENTGAISGQLNGVAMSSGFFTNYGTIYGTTNGAFLTGGLLSNSKDISGGAYGVSESGGNVANYGLISGSNYGMYAVHGTVTNAGTIAGAIDAIKGQFITLVVEPGAVFSGQVANANGKSLLELAGSGLGTLGGIGSQITGFKEISFASGPQWSIEGDEAGFATAETIVGFAKGDTITLDGFTESSFSYVRGTGLELASANGSATLDITGNFTTNSFHVTEAAGKTTILDVTCFAKGTRIATPAGEVAVENLRIGDPVCTRFGGVQPVKWIGSRSYGGAFIRGNTAALPVRIKAGAIAEGVPARDLLVSPGHAISIDDVLVHAKRLLNGVSIIQQAVAEITYFHVELAAHEILIAENCPAESFMDEHFRRQFHNAEEYYRLYPGQTAPAIMCQPRLDSGFLLHAIQRRLRARAGIIDPPPATGPLRGYVDQADAGLCVGWAQHVDAPDEPVSLDILCEGQRIGRVLANLYRADVAAAGHGNGYQGFEFQIPPGITGPMQVRRSSDGAPLSTAHGPALAGDRAA